MAGQLEKSLEIVTSYQQKDPAHPYLKSAHYIRLMLGGAVKKGGVEEGRVLVLHVGPLAIGVLNPDRPQKFDAVGVTVLPVVVVRGGRDDGAAGGGQSVLDLATFGHRHVLGGLHHIVVNYL